MNNITLQGLQLKTTGDEFKEINAVLQPTLDKFSNLGIIPQVGDEIHLEIDDDSFPLIVTDRMFGILRDGNVYVNYFFDEL